MSKIKGLRKIIMIGFCVIVAIILQVFKLLDTVIAGIIISAMGFFAAANTWEHYQDTKKKEIDRRQK